MTKKFVRVTNRIDANIGVGNADFVQAMGLPWLLMQNAVKQVHSVWAQDGRTVLSPYGAFRLSRFLDLSGTRSRL